MPETKIIEDGRPCVNVSFYGRSCVLTAHTWQQPCRFQVDADEDCGVDYDLAEGTTLRDLLEALSAGGRVAISAAMRWAECTLHRRAVEAEELFGAGHILAQDRRSSVELIRGEQEIVMRYLDRAPSKEAGHV